MDSSSARIKITNPGEGIPKLAKPYFQDGFYYSNVIEPFEKLYDKQYHQEVINHLRKSISFKDDIDIYLHHYCPLDADPEQIFILNRDRRRILILVADESYYVPAYLTDHFDAVFKNFLPDMPWDSNLYPLPAGYAGEKESPGMLPVNERSNDVFFSGRIQPNRKDLYRALTVLRFIPSIHSRLDSLLARIYQQVLRNKRIKSVPNSFLYFYYDKFYSGPLNSRRFNEMLENSKIALCPNGRALESFRHIEAAKVGCIVLSNTLPENHFYKKAPFIIFNSWEKVSTVISELLSDQDELEKRQAQTLDWWINFASEESVARFIVERTKEALGSENQ